jgi:putative ABC transport system permease protein
MHPGRILETLLHDVNYALRGFNRARGFTATVVVMLAVAIGANTAIFSLVDNLLLRELPYPDSNRLVMVYELFKGNQGPAVSPANWFDWQRMNHSFESLAAWNGSAMTLTGLGDPEMIIGQVVSSDFFAALKTGPSLGRTFTADEDRPDVPRVIVLSNGLWERRFGSDPAVVGKKIDLDAVPYEVIGVMPAGFHFINPQAEYWAPMAVDRARDWRGTAGRSLPGILGRLKPGLSRESADAEMKAIASQLEQSYVFNQYTSARVVPLRDTLTGEVRTSLLVLFGAVSLLLVIACFNVASMMLARSSSRRREIAVRASLGASRRTIVRQLLVESVLLSAVAGAAGFLVALWGVSALLELTPSSLIPLNDVPLDRWILMYTMLTSLLTGFMFGLLPAITATRGSLAEYLHGGGRSVTRSTRIRRWLVVAQVTMTVVLLCGSGLLVRSFAALTSVRTGVDTDVLTMQITMPNVRYNSERQVAFVRSAVERLESIPGVQTAGATRSLPVIGPVAITGFHIAGTPDVSMNERQSARIRIATPGYFKTAGVPIVRGRDFTWDDERANAEPVIIVNEAFVKAYLSGKDPLSVSLNVFMGRTNPGGRIAGVASDVRESSLRSESLPTVFLTHGPLTYNAMTLYVRGAGSSLAREAVQAIHELDSNIAVTQVRPLRDALGSSIVRERLNAVVTTAFAVTALLLASFGLYGLLAFLVAERTREIGIRMALGAQAGAVLRMVMNHGLSLVAGGAVVGLLGGLAVANYIQALLFGIPSYDPMTFAGVAVVVLFVSAIAAFVPAHRATRVDPLVALRQE